MDIHNENGRYERAISQLKEDKDITKNNKAKIIEFCNYIFANSITLGRIRKYVYTLGNLAKMLKMDFDKATKDDIIRVVREIESKDYKDWTKHDYKIILKRFYKWLKGLDDDDYYPAEVRWIKANFAVKNRKLPDELLTEEEVKRMIDATYNLRDKSLISILWESGARVGEISSSLLIKNVAFDKYGAVLTVDGKTGMRRVRLVSSASLLADWLNAHPDKDNPEAPLWLGAKEKNNGKAISYNNVCGLLKRIGQKAGIKKNIHPHLFRHSRATYLAKFLTEAQMNEYLGWVQGSDMPRTYVHLSGRDVDSALLKLYGIKHEDKKEIEEKPKRCPRCKEYNTGNKFCGKCSLPLDLETAISIDQAKEEFIDMLAKAKPEDRDKLLEIKKNWSAERKSELEEMIRKIIRQEIKNI